MKKKQLCHSRSTPVVRIGLLYHEAEHQFLSCFILYPSSFILYLLSYCSAQYMRLRRRLLPQSSRLSRPIGGQGIRSILCAFSFVVETLAERAWRLWEQGSASVRRA